jgi:AcrR family transcriptional regulator
VSSQAGTPQVAEPRPHLVAAAIAYLSERGVSDVSLRELATALGTSHRMLIYYFGSKEGLLVEVVREVERRQREALVALSKDTDGTPIEVARRFWHTLRSPALAPSERLFFELYGQALQGRPYAVAFLDGIVDSWVDVTLRLFHTEGLSEQEARTLARLGIAVTRGLLLDVLATGDGDGVDAAFEEYLAAITALHGALAGVVEG